MGMENIHRQLLESAAYPDATASVAFRETHISRIYLTDQHVYKLKKPLDLGFLDFTSLAKRRHFCHEEVRLNRRFAPGIYLGVSELRETDGRVRFDGPGRLIDYAVHMRRLPEERMLGRMVDNADSTLPVAIPRLASKLVQVFARADICRGDRLGAHAEVVASNCRENLLQTRFAIGQTLTATAHRIATDYTENGLAQLHELFIHREATGYVRDGHGDLHADNICLTDPIQVYDCIEFNRQFRIGDIAADLAFLLMDLDFRDRRDLGQQLLAAFQAEAQDPELEKLLPFYKFYRAWVRGKVDSILAVETETAPATRAQAAALARRYFNLALGYLLPPTLLLTCGLMGVGKTTFSRALALASGALHLRSDLRRKELADRGEASRDAPFEQGLYAAEMTDRTYTSLLADVEQGLGRGRTVIVDASFADRKQRKRFLDLADKLGRPGYLMHLHCPRQLALTRLDQRQAAGRDISDGRRELYPLQAAGFAAIEPGAHTLEVDTSHPVDYNVQFVLGWILDPQRETP